MSQDTESTTTWEEPATDAPVKPLLRGWLHLFFAPVILITGIALTVYAPTVATRLGCGIYSLCAVLLFATSAVYHRGTWRPETLARFRRADHSNIFVFIAGTYTPLAIALLDGPARTLLLSLVWIVALAGVAFRILWLGAPRWLYTVMYVAMGWLAVGWMPQFWAQSPTVVVLLALGGLIYTFGAFAYGAKKPNPVPGVFGFHEVFHLCTVLAAVCHAACIAIAVLG